ncbi:MAG: cell division protein SepF [Clostridia bacterium]|nr:cell division protein SepF [Clostridia bacterium]
MKNPFNRKPARNDYDSYDDSYDNDFYRGDEDEEDGILGDYDDETEAAPALPAKKASRTGGGNMLKVVKPHGYQDGPAIADYLSEGYTVVMNIEELERTPALRLIDFLLGALQVLGGELKRVTKTTLVLSPRSGEVLGEEEHERDEGEL